MRGHSKHLFFLFFVVLISCTSNSDKNLQPLTKKYFLGLYVSYLIDVEAGRFPKSIEEHFGLTIIDELRKSYNLSDIKPDDVGWLVFSSYIPAETIQEYYLSIEKDGSACFTVIGKSHDDLSMYVNFKYVQEGNDWKIATYDGHSFGESIKPTFPTGATCPKNS